MLRPFLLLVAVIVLFYSCKKPVAGDPFAQFIKQNAAQQDFITFREILEEAHPALTEYISEKRKDFIFDSVYKTIPLSLTLREFYNKLAYLVNEIGCSHTNLSFPPSVIDSVYNNRYFFPFPVILVGNQLLANSDEVVPAGSIVLSVNKHTVANLLDSLAMYNPVDGNHRVAQDYLACLDFGYNYYTRFKSTEKFEVVVKDTSGLVETLFLDAISFNELNERQQSLYYYDATDVPYSFSINDENKYAQLRLSTFEFPSVNKQRAFENFLKTSFELLHLKKNINTLIIDIRENTGGDLYNCFLLNSYLTQKSFTEYQAVSAKIKKVPYLEYLAEDFDRDDLKSINNRLKSEFEKNGSSGYIVPDSLIAKWDPDKNHFSKNIIVVANSAVMSSASYFALLAKNSAGAKIVGSETRGGAHSGNGFATLKYSLPHTKIGFYFAYAKLLYTHGGTKSGSGVIPDYTVPDSYESFKNNKDEQLNFIMDSLITRKER
jgi:hypothetical protein